jgi:ADP-ribosylglycohydrolase
MTDIASTSYVIDTLESSVWSLLNSANYSDATLKAVNLGLDTDTVGCITGGLAGLHYGLNDIGFQWSNHLIRKEDILDLANRYYESLVIHREKK